MGYELAQSFPVARATFEQADELSGFSLSRLAWDGPEEALNDTLNTQPALLTHSVAVLRVFQELFPGHHPACVAGHSMGEISALVACEALPFADALRLTGTRGELMKQAGDISPGGMAAVVGLDIPTLEKLCTQASTPEETVQVANDNCPGQVVISGAKEALERVLRLAKDSGARMTVPLAVSIASHSPLMVHAQADFNHAVDIAPIANPRLPLYGNVTAQPLHTAEQIRADLQAQLTSRVRWTDSVQAMIALGVTTFIEMGRGSVLAGLLKRIDRRVNCYSLGTPSDFEKMAKEHPLSSA